MWVSSLLLGWGLRQKERMRDALLASGAVWTMHEHVARRLRNQVRKSCVWGAMRGQRAEGRMGKEDEKVGDEVGRVSVVDHQTRGIGCTRKG